MKIILLYKNERSLPHAFRHSFLSEANGYLILLNMRA